MNPLKRAKEIINIEIEELRWVASNLNASFSHSVELMLQAVNNGGKIVVTGVGKCFHIAEKISATLASTGTTSVPLHPSQALHGDLGILTKNDLLLVLSYSGESDELIEILPSVKRAGIKIIAMTAFKNSTLARTADNIIQSAVRREACPFNMAPTASTTAMLAIGDALAIILLEARGFKKEDFAKLHPGGAIGKTLLLKVADIMRKDEHIAKVRENARIRDALFAMTSARAGAVAVVNIKNKVIGVFTDGDLRRLINQNSRDIPQLKMREVMTKNPITISETALAVDALKIFEEHAIDDIIVVDKDKNLKGIIDIQDMPRFKIL
jgi:arabinose-5-phosphate isomerase